MSKQKMYQVDAFTDKLFGGNPAAVCIMNSWPDDHVMQAIASENNLAETAFAAGSGNRYEIRWFTPLVEVELCGHATLAASYVLFNYYGIKENEIHFESLHSGELKVTRENSKLFLDFPADKLTPSDDYLSIEPGIGFKPVELYKGKTDYMAVLNSEEDIKNLKLNFQEIEKLDARGLIVTARGNTADFVSRFFAPQCGVAEDPVTGSAHTSLIPYWAEKLGKRHLTAKQISKRGGVLDCTFLDNRVLIGGEARLFLTGEINLD